MSETPEDGGPEPGRIGRGLLEDGMAPGSGLAHLYRAEVHRMTRWRERLDRTTHWAVTVMAAILTWAFSDPENPHFLILMGAVAVGLFLGIEAHRFRGYIVWRTRVRLLQENVWAQGLDPTSDLLHPDWRGELAEDYRYPTLKISSEEALAHRLRRIYLPMLSIVLLAWLIRTTALSPTTLPGSAAIGAVRGSSCWESSVRSTSSRSSSRSDPGRGRGTRNSAPRRSASGRRSEGRRSWWVPVPARPHTSLRRVLTPTSVRSQLLRTPSSCGGTGVDAVAMALLV